MLSKEDYEFVKTSSLELKARETIHQIQHEAFSGQPFYRAAFPDDQTRIDTHKVISKIRLDTCLDQSFVLLKDKEIVGHVVIKPAGVLDPSFSVWTAYKAGFFSWIFSYGYSTYSHFMNSLRIFMDSEKGLHDDVKSCCWIEQFCIDETCRGQGLGSKMMEMVLDQVPSSSIILTTQLESNVRFYKRFGFKVIKEDVVKFTTGSFTNWSMRLDR